MCAEKFDLKPAEQCTKNETGHFGETYKEVYQPNSGLLARKISYTPEQRESLEEWARGRSGRDGERADIGPSNSKYTEVAFDNKIYSLGEDKKNLTINSNDVAAGSPQYKEAIAKIDAAKKELNFDAPFCTTPTGGLWQSLEQKK